MKNPYIIPFASLSMNDLERVGGKNASLGEMNQHLTSLGIDVPDGFAVSVDAYNEFLSHNTLSPLIQTTLNRLDRTTLANLSEVAESCRSIILQADLPEGIKSAIESAYKELILSGGSGIVGVHC